MRVNRIVGNVDLRSLHIPHFFWQKINNTLLYFNLGNRILFSLEFGSGNAGLGFNK